MDSKIEQSKWIQKLNSKNKHLETKTFTIFGLGIDIFSSRKDSYNVTGVTK